MAEGRPGIGITGRVGGSDNRYVGWLHHGGARGFGQPDSDRHRSVPCDETFSRPARRSAAGNSAEIAQRGRRRTWRITLVVGDQLRKSLPPAATGTEAIETSVPRPGPPVRTSRGTEACLRGPGNQNRSRGNAAPSGGGPERPTFGIGRTGTVLQNVGELDGQDRQLLREPLEQRPHRRLQPQPPMPFVASLRHGKLQPLPPAG